VKLSAIWRLEIGACAMTHIFIFGEKICYEYVENIEPPPQQRSYQTDRTLGIYAILQEINRRKILLYIYMYKYLCTYA